MKIRPQTVDALLRASELLKQAYTDGQANGGSIEWADLDLAHIHAVKAVRMYTRDCRGRS